MKKSVKKNKAYLFFGIVIGTILILLLSKYILSNSLNSNPLLAAVSSCPVGSPSYPDGYIDCVQNENDGSLGTDCFTKLNFNCINTDGSINNDYSCCMVNKCRYDSDCPPAPVPEGHLLACQKARCIEGVCIEDDANEGSKCKETDTPEGQTIACTQNVCRSGACTSEKANEGSTCTGEICGLYCTTVTGVCNSGQCKGELRGSGACDGYSCNSGNPKDEIGGYCLSEQVCVPCFKDEHCADNEICKEYECVPKPSTGTLPITGS